MNKIRKLSFGQIIYFLILGFVLMFPKFNLINVPGTYIGIRAEDFMIALFLLVVFVKEMRKEKKDRITTKNASLRKISQVFSVFFILTVISTIFGAINGYINVAHGLLFCIRNLEYFLFIIVGIMFGKKYGKEDKLFHFIVWCLLIHVAIGFLQYFGVLGALKDGAMVTSRGSRVWSTFNGPYEFSGFLTMVAPVCLYMFLEGKKVFFYGVAVLAALAGVLLSQSRSSLIVLAVLIGWLIARDFLKMAKYGKERKALARNVILILCMAVVTVTLAQGNTLMNRFASIKTSDIVESTKGAIEEVESTTESGGKPPSTNVSAQAGDTSYNIRIRKWIALFNDFMESPVIGCGPSAASEAADGNYVRLLAESGVLGLTLWLVFIATILKNLDKKKKTTYIMVVYSTMALLMTAVFIDIFIASKIMMLYYILVGYNISGADEKKRIE